MNTSSPLATAIPTATGPVPVVVLISGSGSNLQALIDTQQETNTRIVAVISNIASAYGLVRAQQAGIATVVVDHRQFADRDSFDQTLIEIIDGYQPALVVLAAGFTDHYHGRMLNIHPSLLPKYKGLHTHQRALEAGDSEHGVTVHFVTSKLDDGAHVIQAKVPVYADDTEETLQKRVLAQEHIIYPMAVGWFASNRLILQNNRALLDESPLPESGFQHTSFGSK